LNSSFTSEACSTCRLLPICAVCPIITANKALDAAMIGCRYYEEGENSMMPFGQNVEEAPSISVDERLKIAEQIREESIAAEEEKQKEVFGPAEGVECSACHKDNVQLVRCDNCGKACCADCLTDTLDGKTLCPDCYDSEDTPSFSL